MTSVSNSRQLAHFYHQKHGKRIPAFEQSHIEQAKTLEQYHADKQISAALAAGVYLYNTSDTQTPPKNVHLLDRHKSRVRRMRRSVITGARMMQEQLQNQKIRYVPWFVTLTYRQGQEWTPYQLTKAVKAMREWFRRQGYSCHYVAVAEIQEKRKKLHGGHCVHYHLCIWVPKHIQLPKFDKRGWWPYGMTQTVKAQNPVGYIAKYATKGGAASDLPKGCRICAVGGLESLQTLKKSWWMLPRYIREKFPDFMYQVIRAPGGGYVSKITGEWVQSEWQIDRVVIDGVQMPGLYAAFRRCPF